MSMPTKGRAHERGSQARALLERGCLTAEKGAFGRALNLFLRAANLGSVEAQVNAANLYDEGKGVRKDRTAARYWYRRAVARGSSEAAYNLAVSYRQRGIVRWAAFWFERARQLGDEDAAAELDNLRRRGLVP